MKSRACRSAAATLGCHKSTMKTTRGPSSAAPVEGEARGQVAQALAVPSHPVRRPPFLDSAGQVASCDSGQRGWGHGGHTGPEGQGRPWATLSQWLAQARVCHNPQDA
jgi:hypothetical protein